ncbi:MAG: ornithine cyclodeaminase family protein [Actinomycetota bacterium]|nr:ornithine cyclodeaminase family protein [Actinomycetota bacterium]|tara:strand:+ start:3314 stop:4237 length:924 start_codon:yes stop_codon:yes gene_type:complete
MKEIPHFSANDIFAFGIGKTISALKNFPTTNNPPIPREHIPLDKGEDFLLMPAVSPTGLGIKLVTVMDKNPNLGLPLVHGFYLYLDRVTGIPKATFDGSALTTLRTPAASAVATEILSLENVETLGVFGTGVQARSHIEAMLFVRPGINKILVCGRSLESAKKFIASLNVEGREIIAGSPEETASCNLICACTSSKTPVIPTESVKPGAHLNLIGSFSEAQKEADTKLIENAKIYVDHRTAAKEEAGELINAELESTWSFDDIQGDFLELVVGETKRNDPETITLFKSVGLAVWDLMVAEMIYNETN